MLIGRSFPDHKVDLDLTDLDPRRTVSRVHAELNGEGMLVDRGSSTFVNEIRIIHPIHLNEGDRVRFGAVVMTYRKGELRPSL